MLVDLTGTPTHLLLGRYRAANKDRGKPDLGSIVLVLVQLCWLPRAFPSHSWQGRYPTRRDPTYLGGTHLEVYLLPAQCTQNDRPTAGTYLVPTYPPTGPHPRGVRREATSTAILGSIGV